MVMGKLAFTQLDPLFRELNDFTDSVEDYKPGPTFDYKFMQFPAGEEPSVIEVDVVIVGSGCGGSVCAKGWSNSRTIFFLFGHPSEDNFPPLGQYSV